MNLYILEENRRGTIFGIGTYIRELIVALNCTGVYITVVHLLADKLQISFEEEDSVQHWYFPAPRIELWTWEDKNLRELYYHNVLYLLQLYIQDKKDLIFHLNYHRNGHFIDELRSVFNCKIVSISHFSDWGFIIFDNLVRLRNVLKEKDPDDISIIIQEKFDEEKDDYMKVDHLICLSNYMANILHRDYGLNSNKISIIPNGLSDEGKILVNKELLRKKWHIRSREKIIIFAGRLDEIKGLTFLIRAFHRLLDNFPSSRLFIVGNGNYNQYFQVAKNDCTRITFTGLIGRGELYELYRIADVGVVPSLFEPFGYVPVEMMMHELPIVATATSGLNEVVDESCGLKIPLVVSPDSVEIDTELLAEKIVYLLQHPTEAARLGKNGRKRYLEKYSSQVFGRNMIAFYNSLFS